jgi:hypothetical protein
LSVSNTARADAEAYDEAELRRDLILIESMVHEGHSEPEIAAAVRGRREDPANQQFFPSLRGGSGSARG